MGWRDDTSGLHDRERYYEASIPQEHGILLDEARSSLAGVIQKSRHTRIDGRRYDVVFILCRGTVHTSRMLPPSRVSEPLRRSISSLSGDAFLFSTKLDISCRRSPFESRLVPVMTGSSSTTPEPLSSQSRRVHRVAPSRSDTRLEQQVHPPTRPTGFTESPSNLRHISPV